MRLRPLALLFCLLLPVAVAGCARKTPAERAADAYAAREMAAAPLHGNLPDYSLPPAALAQAQRLESLRNAFYFGGEAWNILQLILLLSLGLIAWLRDLAVRSSRRRWVQGYLFFLLLLLAHTLLDLPLNLYGHHVALKYRFSIQSWPGWSLDLAKGLAIEWIAGGALAVLLFWTIRRAPRRWWLVFWAAAVPIALGGVYLSPVAINPLFNRFEPLALHHPALAAQLEHMGVPANRQFLMKASAKVTTPNAYVTGLGNTKRIVVWDTSLTAGQPPSPEVLWMVGHECGHYVLNHVLKGTLLTLAGLLPLLCLSYLLLQKIIARFGPRWRIVTQDDWGSLAVLLLIFALLGVVAGPIANTVSRHIEHDADVYGEEAIHGIVPDPQAAVQAACDSDGLRTLEDPNPGRFIELWTYDHPATGRRAAFGKAYDPWKPGFEPKYFETVNSE